MNANFGFTIKELSAILCCVSIGVALFASNQPIVRAGAKTAVCHNNLRVVSQALLNEALENSNRFYWARQEIPGQGASPNVWEHFIALSNYLSSPRVFACPADKRLPALHFGTEVEGLAHMEKQNNAISYFLSPDAFIGVPNNALIGERNMDGGIPTSCGVIAPSTGAYAFDRLYAQDGRLSWKPMLHGPDFGLVATVDGNVQVLDTPGLNRAFRDFEGDGNFNNHVLLPF